MTAVCYAACGVALVSAVLVVTGRHAMHALLHLILMLLAVALAFFTLGAPFAAAIQVIVYAGAIMVLFVFVVMMLNLATAEHRERQWTPPRAWAIPLALAAALLTLSGYALSFRWSETFAAMPVAPRAVGIALYREYLLGVEIVSLLLVAGLVAAFHIAPRPRAQRAEEEPGSG